MRKGTEIAVPIITTPPLASITKRVVEVTVIVIVIITDVTMTTTIEEMKNAAIDPDHDHLIATVVATVAEI